MQSYQEYFSPTHPVSDLFDSKSIGLRGDHSQDHCCAIRPDAWISWAAKDQGHGLVRIRTTPPQAVIASGSVGVFRWIRQKIVCCFQYSCYQYMISHIYCQSYVFTRKNKEWPAVLLAGDRPPFFGALSPVVRPR